MTRGDIEPLAAALLGLRREARYRDRLQRMVAVSDIVKVSDEDLHWIMPGNDRSTDEKGQALLDAGVKLVVVTRGEFVLAPTLAEAMYDNNFRALVPGRRIAIVAPEKP